MPADDPLATELAAIRRRAEQITTEHDVTDCDLDGETCTGHDAERLLAAVEGVLALCEKPSTGIPPIRIREAITRELLGEDTQ